MTNFALDSRQNFGGRYFSDLWRYRHLCWNLVGSDLRSRFRRSRLGLLWAVLQPLCFSLMIAIVWGALFQQGFMTYAVYVFSGMLVWEYFTNVVFQAQDSLVASEGYLKQGRIPLIVFQMRGPVAGMIVFVAGMLGYFALVAALDQLPKAGFHLLLVLAFLPVLLAFLTPIAIIFSILGTQYRDLRHATAIAVNALFFLSPIMIAREYLESERLVVLHYANPMMPLLDMMRAPLLDSTYWNNQDVMVLGGWIVGLWVLALSLSARFGRRIVFAL